MKHFIQRCAWAVTVLALVGTAPARAGVIFSNFGPGDSFNDGGGFTIGLGQTAGNAFVVPGGSDYTLDSITAALTFANGPVNEVILSLETDQNNQPGAILESWTIDNLPRTGLPASATTVDSTLHPLLQAGVQYWVVASNPDPSFQSSNTWNFTSPDVQGTVWTNNSGTSVASQSAFSVSGSSAVPEPATLTLSLIAGLMSLAARCRGRYSVAR